MRHAHLGQQRRGRRKRRRKQRPSNPGHVVHATRMARYARQREHSLTTIRLAESKDFKALAEMRALLWPESSYEEHLAELEAGPSALCQPGLPLEWLVAEDESGELTGFLEVGLRSHADGC